MATSPRRSRFPTVIVGVVVLAFYLSLSAPNAFAVVALQRLHPNLLAAAVVGVAVAVALGYLSFRFDTVRLLSQLDARDMSPTESPSIHRLRDRLTERVGLNPPTLELARLAAPSAMAPDPMSHDVVVLDASLFRLLDANEFEALSAHELAHLERRGGLVQSLVASVLRTVVSVDYLFVSPVTFLTTGVALGSTQMHSRPGSWIETFIRRACPRLDEFIGLFGFGFIMFIRSQSREREFAVDARAVEVTDKPVAPASALRKLERAARPQRGLSPLQMYDEIEVEDSMLDLLSTRPSTDERVGRLAAIADESMTRIEVR